MALQLKTFFTEHDDLRWISSLGLLAWKREWTLALLSDPCTCALGYLQHPPAPSQPHRMNTNAN